MTCIRSLRLSMLPALLMSASAQAGLYLTTQTYPPDDTANYLRSSYFHVEAETRSTGQQFRADLGESLGQQSLSAEAQSGLGNFSYVSASVITTAERLQISVDSIDRLGPSRGTVYGAFVFGVTEPTRVSITGFLSLDAATTDEPFFSAQLYDAGSGDLVMSSVQGDLASNATYLLGGLQGVNDASFQGSLTPLLTPGSTYALLYTFSTRRWSAGADRSFATGRVAVAAQPIPEPETVALALTGLMTVAVWARRTNARALR